MSASSTPADGSEQTDQLEIGTGRGRWKIGAGLLTVAIVAQSILWGIWWEDPTHFKMSILFVWPAALFFLLIWWTFFSGWSSRVRFGSTLSLFSLIGLFLLLFEFDKFDGDMVPRRISFRWAPSREDEVRKFFNQVRPAAPVETEVDVKLVATEEDWPGYRGLMRDGIIRSAELKGDWNSSPPQQIWRHPVGKGWSSFAVIGTFAYTQEQRETGEAVVAYNFETGEQRWIHVDQVEFQGSEAQGGTGPRATPTFDEGRIYSQGAIGLLNCLDASTGKVIWSKDILKDTGKDGLPTPNLGWGTAASPLIVNEMVIVIPGGKDGQSVVAYEKESGKRVWASGNHPASYGSARAETLLGESVILVPFGDGVAGYAPANGRELWFHPWSNGPLVNSALPVVIDDDSFVFGCGYGVGSVRLKVARTGEDWTIAPMWTTNRFRPKFNDFVLSEGHLYGLDDGTLTCVDVETGKVKWKSGRYGYGQILLAGQKLLILSESGKVVVIPATPDRPDVISEFQALDESGITWNHPVAARGKLLVRNAYEAACYRLD